jgi:hypothetical protein
MKKLIIMAIAMGLVLLPSSVGASSDYVAGGCVATEDGQVSLRAKVIAYNRDRADVDWELRSRRG